MEEKFVYLYKATFYDENITERKEGGIIIAASYADALAQIAAYYENDLIDLYTEAIDSYYPMTFHLDQYETIKEIAVKS